MKMSTENTPVTRTVNELTAAGLDPRDLGWQPEHPQSEWLLGEILRWVRGWRRLGSRQAMSRAGFLFPPVEPDCDPAQDWFVFERWVTRQPLTWSYVAEFGQPTAAAALNDSQLAVELTRVQARLDARGVRVAAVESLPPRELYGWLAGYVAREPFEYLAEGVGLTLTGCDGDCPDCFQQPWCDLCDSKSDADETTLCTGT